MDRDDEQGEVVERQRERARRLADDTGVIGSEAQEPGPGRDTALTDPDPVARRAAVDVLETMGADAAPALPGLVRALSDRDLFVRWTAARSPACSRSRVPAGASGTTVWITHGIRCRMLSAVSSIGGATARRSASGAKYPA